MASLVEAIRAALRQVKDPATGQDVVAAGMVEERMSAFYDKRYEVLVSTTIVESGIDKSKFQAALTPAYADYAKKFGNQTLERIRDYR